jgi:protein-tyrosine phosphatase
MQPDEGEVRTSDTHPLGVAWVELDSAPGHLGITMAPGRTGGNHFSSASWRRDLHADLRRLRHVHRCDVLVSLLPDEELAELGLEELPAAVDVHGLSHRRLSVADGSIPTPEQEGEVLVLIDELRDALLAGKTVVLHCRAGFGRAGTLAAVLVASLWELPADAIARVRAAQPRAVETVQQEHFVNDAAFRWFSHHVRERAS